jgi:magnesium chelatase family protein
MDRIDLQVEVPAHKPEFFAAAARGESSAIVRRRVAAARERQIDRQGSPNARLEDARIEAACLAEASALAFLAQSAGPLALSARAHTRVLKVARTIADLAGNATVREEHVAEALRYRL